MVHKSLEVSNSDIEIHDTLELITFTLSQEFKEKWKFKYSSSFVEAFQKKFLAAIEARKPIKKTALTRFLVDKCGYSEEQVRNFYESINLEIYSPLIS